MSKAEEQARKAYPDNPYYGGRSAQKLFAEGYNQALQDLMADAIETTIDGKVVKVIVIDE